MFRKHLLPIAMLALLLSCDAHLAVAQTTVVQRPDGSTATVTVQAGGGNTNTVMIVGGGSGQAPPAGGVQINGVQLEVIGGAGANIESSVVSGQGGGGGPLVQLPARDQAPAVGTSRIRGRVIAEGSGRPLRRANVRLSSPGIRESRSATTNQEGSFEFVDLPAASYNLVANRSGYVQMGYKQTRPNGPPQPLVLGANQTLERVDIALPLGGVITGRVLDEYGEPVSDTFVSAQRQQFINGARRPLTTGAPSGSNDIGEFRIYGLAPGDYYVSANPRGGSSNPFETTADRSGYGPTYYPSSTDVASAQRVTVRAGDTVSNIVVTLAPTRMARVSGTVIDTQGQPAKGGAVMAMPSGGMTMPMSPGMVRPDGTFTLNNVAPGDYVLRSVPTGGITGPSAFASIAMATISVNGSDLSNVVLQPQTPIVIKGRLTGDATTLSKVKPATTRLMAAPYGPPMMMVGPTTPPQPLHDDLSFELSVYPGEYAIRPMALPDMVVRAVRLDGRDVTKSFRVDPGAALNDIEVEVTASTARLVITAANARNEAAASRDVVVFPQDETQWGLQMPGHSSTGRTDEQGRYQTPPLLPGAYYVALPDAMEVGQAADPEFLESLRTKAQRITVGESATANVQLRVSER